MTTRIEGSCQSGKHHRRNAADNGSHGQLALGPDVPDIGHVANRKPDADQNKRCCLDDELLNRPKLRERFDKINVKPFQRIDAPRKAKISPPAISVSSSARKGEATAKNWERSLRFSRTSRMGCLHFLVRTGHQQADFFRRHFMGGMRLGKLPA